MHPMTRRRMMRHVLPVVSWAAIACAGDAVAENTVTVGDRIRIRAPELIRTLDTDHDLEGEQSNYRRALAWTVATGETVLAMRLVGGLAR